MKKKITCPICKKETTLGQSNSFRPFCSDRCRLIDLGEWITEKYTVSDPVIPNTNNIEIIKSTKKH